MTPSEIVDEVWHQHLIYSRDYWDVWCAQVLRKPLHHIPTAGGLEAQQRFCAQYAQTLALHEHFFGPPPLDLWPATHGAFSAPSRNTGSPTGRARSLCQGRMPCCGAFLGTGSEHEPAGFA